MKSHVHKFVDHFTSKHSKHTGATLIIRAYNVYTYAKYNIWSNHKQHRN